MTSAMLVILTLTAFHPFLRSCKHHGRQVGGAYIFCCAEPALLGRRHPTASRPCWPDLRRCFRRPHLFGFWWSSPVVVVGLRRPSPRPVLQVTAASGVLAAGYLCRRAWVLDRRGFRWGHICPTMEPEPRPPTGQIERGSDRGDQGSASRCLLTNGPLHDCSRFHPSVPQSVSSHLGGHSSSSSSAFSWRSRLT